MSDEHDPTREGPFEFGCFQPESDELAATCWTTRELNEQLCAAFANVDRALADYVRSKVTSPQELLVHAMTLIHRCTESVWVATLKEAARCGSELTAETLPTGCRRDWSAWAYRQFKYWKTELSSS